MRFGFHGHRRNTNTRPGPFELKTAQTEKTIGTIFNELFKQAVTVGKRTHAETDIGANAVSVSYAAVELAKKIFGSLSNKHILILGAGKWASSPQKTCTDRASAK